MALGSWNGVQLLAWVRRRDEGFVEYYRDPGAWERWQAEKFYPTPGLMTLEAARVEACEALQAGAVTGYDRAGTALPQGYWLQHVPDARAAIGTNFPIADAKAQWKPLPAPKPTHEQVVAFLMAYYAEHSGAKRDPEVFPACKAALPGVTKRQMETAMRDVPIRGVRGHPKSPT